MPPFRLSRQRRLTTIKPAGAAAGTACFSTGAASHSPHGRTASARRKDRAEATAFFRTVRAPRGCLDPAIRKRNRFVPYLLGAPTRLYASYRRKRRNRRGRGKRERRARVSRCYAFMIRLTAGTRRLAGCKACLIARRNAAVHAGLSEAARVLLKNSGIRSRTQPLHPFHAEIAAFVPAPAVPYEAAHAYTETRPTFPLLTASPFSTSCKQTKERGTAMSRKSADLTPPAYFFGRKFI